MNDRDLLAALRVAAQDVVDICTDSDGSLYLGALELSDIHNLREALRLSDTLDKREEPHDPS